jgi:putative NIF3 family GTP cyclohydrolase 1 type 2
MFKTDDQRDTSRRAVLFGAAGLAAVNRVRAQGAGKTLTAGEVIQRIKANIGIPWRDRTVDNIIAGSPDTPVQGIAVTMMATLDVVQRAAAAGKNMVITHEPTYYSHQDKLDDLAEDETYRFKANFLRQNKMVVFHLHDHWHRRRPDGIAMGMARELGWEKNMDAENPRLYSFDGVTLANFARNIQSRLKIRTMRVVGDPEMTVKRVMTSWGYVSQMPGIPFIARPDVDLLVVGETREWELVEYVQDMAASGKNKALILLGHVVSEQAGMKYFGDWLKPFVPEVPVEFIPAAEPFWRPDAPEVGGGLNKVEDTDRVRPG